MNLRTRRIVYLIFILIFLIATPIVILYTAGYRYNWQKTKLQKTGIMIIKSKPEGAQIFLNGNLQKITTPGRLDNLLPEDYLIKVQKEGFYPWQKTLPVKSRLTTFAEDITLFKQSLPVIFIEGEIGFISLSPDKTKIAYQLKRETGDEIWIADLKNQKKDLLHRSAFLEDGNEPNFEWNSDGQKIMFPISNDSQKMEYVIFDILTKTATTYQSLSEFYFDFKGVNNKNLGWKTSDDLVFIPGPSGLTVVLDKKTSDLKMWNTGSGDLVFETRAKDAVWSEKGDKLLYVNDLEIWLYDIPADREILLTRYSKEIKGVSWINNNYILALFDNTLKAIELDERDQRNTTDLAGPEDIKNFEVEPGAQKIYFSGTLGKKEGVFELPY